MWRWLFDDTKIDSDLYDEKMFRMTYYAWFVSGDVPYLRIVVAYSEMNQVTRVDG